MQERSSASLGGGVLRDPMTGDEIADPKAAYSQIGDLYFSSAQSQAMYFAALKRGLELRDGKMQPVDSSRREQVWVLSSTSSSATASPKSGSSRSLGAMEASSSNISGSDSGVRLSSSTKLDPKALEAILNEGKYFFKASAPDLPNSHLAGTMFSGQRHVATSVVVTGSDSKRGVILPKFEVVLSPENPSLEIPFEVKREDAPAKAKMTFEATSMLKHIRVESCIEKLPVSQVFKDLEDARYLAKKSKEAGEFIVELDKDAKGMGMTLGWDPSRGCVIVKSIEAGGVADRTKLLHLGDGICAVQGIRVIGEPLSSTIQRIRNIPMTMILTMSPAPADWTPVAVSTTVKRAAAPAIPPRGGGKRPPAPRPPPPAPGTRPAPAIPQASDGIPVAMGAPVDMQAPPRPPMRQTLSGEAFPGEENLGQPLPPPRVRQPPPPIPQNLDAKRRDPPGPPPAMDMDSPPAPVARQSSRRAPPPPPSRQPLASGDDVPDAISNSTAPSRPAPPPVKPRAPPPPVPSQQAPSQADSAPAAASSGGSNDFGPQYERYVRMKKAGLPEGAILNAMHKEGVAPPPGFFSAEWAEDANKAPATIVIPRHDASSAPPAEPRPAGGSNMLSELAGFNKGALKHTEVNEGEAAGEERQPAGGGGGGGIMAELANFNKGGLKHTDPNAAPPPLPSSRGGIADAIAGFDRSKLRQRTDSEMERSEQEKKEIAKKGKAGFAGAIAAAIDDRRKVIADEEDQDDNNADWEF